MSKALISVVILCLFYLIKIGVVVYLIFLAIKALKTYINSKEVREEKDQPIQSLGEVLKAHRMRCKMTQEFVAEAIGVSRQAVSKWESGAADPSTMNLTAVAKLYGLEPEELLRETREQKTSRPIFRA